MRNAHTLHKNMCPGVVLRGGLAARGGGELRSGPVQCVCRAGRSGAVRQSAAGVGRASCCDGVRGAPRAVSPAAGDTRRHRSRRRHPASGNGLRRHRKVSPAAASGGGGVMWRGGHPTAVHHSDGRYEVQV